MKKKKNRPLTVEGTRYYELAREVADLLGWEQKVCCELHSHGSPDDIPCSEIYGYTEWDERPEPRKCGVKKPRGVIPSECIYAFKERVAPYAEDLNLICGAMSSVDMPEIEIRIQSGSVKVVFRKSRTSRRLCWVEEQIRSHRGSVVAEATARCRALVRWMEEGAKDAGTT